ncbi:hypothetical protein CspeluHIS016_0104720 [Cutaneotrichosporon spelunceum]|uniref:NADH dehydrogenase [ubiquinone] 1 alpha subcomplex subunit 11 n=1 Tax=Cutaneotrichosporon spelunceum TaxID=1672016 RepID=A0AAD3Y848_9TREE|nr:hypothetical protein CspeluHIS016_0104720 [Cutaneotrichosporon spelunceum]
MAPASHPLLAPLSGSSKALFFNSPNEEQMFHEHPTLKSAIRVTLQSAGAGLVVSAAQNALDTHNHGAAGIFTRTGSTIGLFAAMGFSYAFVTNYVANIRQVDSPLNGAAGGCASGFVAGLSRGSLPVAFGACAGMATLIGTFQAAGNNLTGGRPDETRPEREERRLRFFKRKPLTEEA